MIVKTGRFMCRFMDEDREQRFETLGEAQNAAAEYVGNSRSSKPFPHEDTYLYGPGDGTTSVMVRAEWHFKPGLEEV